ncbi:resolvase domain-containing protein [Burkholderia pseudomallei]|nr:resolvase domain-containing protein [Burkholderia pseudomallei]
MTVLAAVSQFERDLLIECTHAGLARAKAEGKKLGRKDVPTLERKRDSKKVGCGRYGQPTGQKVCGCADLPPSIGPMGF